MWTGTDEEYFRLYATTAKRIKQRWPGLKVGGPAVGNTGELADGKLRPSPFVVAFLERCRRDGLPLDFFSWHVYTNDSREVAARAREVRRLLDGHGFKATESHLNEWNYLPDKDWTPVGRGGQGAARQRFYERLGGAEGAAFAAATLVRLQDEPLDAACFFNATSNGFGLFNPSGVPKKNYHAFRAFRMFAASGRRVEVSDSTLAAGAAAQPSGESVTVLVCNESPKAAPVVIAIKGFPWAGAVSLNVWTLDAHQDLDETESGELAPGERTIDLTVPGHSVTVIRVRRPAPAAAPPGR
jgi:hypothetical protein